MIAGVMGLLRGQMLTAEMKNHSYNEVLKKRLTSDPATCLQCGQCVVKCPYNLPVSALIQRAVALFDEG